MNFTQKQIYVQNNVIFVIMQIYGIQKKVSHPQSMVNLNLCLQEKMQEAQIMYMILFLRKFSLRKKYQ